MKFKLTIKCPYCDAENTIEISEYTPQVFVCNVDCGGCDEDFMVKPKIKVDVEVYTVKRVEK